MKNLLLRHRDVLLYLVTGAWNTCFGLGVFSLLYLLGHGRIHHLALAAISHELGILNAYVSYKRVVFKTRGDVAGELLRFHGVYGLSALVSVGLLHLLAGAGGLHPVAAQAVITALVVSLSYLGHKSFSFVKGGPGSDPRPRESGGTPAIRPRP